MASLSGVCKTCGTVCVAREQFTQATREEPMRSLGVFAYCRRCEVSFPVETPQLAYA